MFLSLPQGTASKGRTYPPQPTGKLVKILHWENYNFIFCAARKSEDQFK